MKEWWCGSTALAKTNSRSLKSAVHRSDYRQVHDLIKKSTGNYRRTPRGRGVENIKNARETGAVKTPRFEATSAVAAKLLAMDEFFFISNQPVYRPLAPWLCGTGFKKNGTLVKGYHCLKV
jgi:hypothetical protein